MSVTVMAGPLAFQALWMPHRWSSSESVERLRGEAILATTGCSIAMSSWMSVTGRTD